MMLPAMRKLDERRKEADIEFPLKKMNYKQARRWLSNHNPHPYGSRERAVWARDFWFDQTIATWDWRRSWPATINLLVMSPLYIISGVVSAIIG
jgi:hypothetical protein